MKIHELIIEAKAVVGPVGKNGQNTQQRFAFRKADDVINAVAPALNRFGIFARPVKCALEVREVASGGGKRQAWVTGTVVYRFTGPEGDYLDAEVATEALDFSDKATAKAMTVAYRIALIQTLNLPTDDPDPDAEYHERGTDSETLRGRIFAACEAQGLTPTDLRAIFSDAGGGGKLSECDDVSVLTAVLSQVESAGGRPR
ncbi:ERF family protein [Nocardia brasiliensis]|uniref:ERF family protein n=1 Tax=Nocardia brasiliensis TaxID=37326 RepID=UPI00367033CA